MKQSQILREATEKYLWDGTPEDYSYEKEKYICFALNEWETYNPEYSFQVQLLKERIHSKIDMRSTVHSWLEYTLKMDVTTMTKFEIQTIRKELVAEIIKELEAQGM